MFGSCFLKLFSVLKNKENKFGSQFCFVLKNTNMLLFSKNYSYFLNLVFYVLFVIYRTKKKKKNLRHVWFLFFKIFYILKNKKNMKNMENTFGFQRHQNDVLYVFKNRSKE